jgi:hypothetical protein
MVIEVLLCLTFDANSLTGVRRDANAVCVSESAEQSGSVKTSLDSIYVITFCVN